MTKLKVDMVSRELGRHKGDPAHLLMDANMVERAIASARAIAAHCGYSTSAFDSEGPEIVDRMIEHIFATMTSPAIDLLSDFRDEYVASGSRLSELHLKDASQTPGVLTLTATLRREPPAIVRVASINIELKDKK